MRVNVTMLVSDSVGKGIKALVMQACQLEFDALKYTYKCQEASTPWSCLLTFIYALCDRLPHIHLLCFYMHMNNDNNNNKM